jgi:hypothetical protein
MIKEAELIASSSAGHWLNSIGISNEFYFISRFVNEFKFARETTILTYTCLCDTHISQVGVPIFRQVSKLDHTA